MSPYSNCSNINKSYPLTPKYLPLFRLPLFPFLTLIYLVCFFCRCIFMDNGMDGLYHWNRVGVLPDVPSKVYTYSAPLHPVCNKFKYLHLSISLWPSSDDHRHGTTVDNLIKIFTPVSLYNLCPKLCGYPATSGEVAGVPLSQLFPDRGNRHNRST